MKLLQLVAALVAVVPASIIFMVAFAAAVGWQAAKDGWKRGVE